MSENLGALDYIIFVVILLVSAGVGIYHALRGDRQRTADEYLLANRSMHPIPVTLSIVVSTISSVTYLGTPAETYINGPGYWVTMLSKVIPVYIITQSFCPIFYNLKITSIYEYLEMRFNKTVRFIGVAINFLYLMLYIGVVIYSPALAINAVTGFSLPGAILSVGLVCTFYTTIGGIKAVMWTDVFQSCIMMTGFLITIIGCSVSVGGFGEVFRISAQGDRAAFFDMRVDPTIRLSFWNVFLGTAILHLSYAGTNQIIVQRYMTCRSLKESRIVAGVGITLTGVVEVTAVIAGLCLYAYYAGCDPLQTGEITRPDQIIAYSMIDLFDNVPGLAGFQIAAVVCASLSTVSSGINALATLTGEDVIKKIYKDMSDFKFTLLLKVVSLLFGAVSIIFAFVVSSLGGILSLVFSLVGILNGPILGVFCLGVYFPWCNSKGAIVGMLCALCIGFWIKAGSLNNPPLSNPPPLSIDQCPLINTTLYEAEITTMVTSFESQDISYTSIGTNQEPEQLKMPLFAPLYSISYMLLSPICTFITIVVGLIVSFATGATDPSTVRSELLCPLALTFCCCLPWKWRGKMVQKSYREGIDEQEYEPVGQDLKMSRDEENVNTPI